MDWITYLRTFRAGPFAIFDFVASYAGIYLLAPVLIWLFKFFGINTTRATWLWLTLPASVLIHLAVGKITPLTAMAIDPSDYWILKIYLFS